MSFSQTIVSRGTCAGRPAHHTVFHEHDDVDGGCLRSLGRVSQAVPERGAGQGLCAGSSPRRLPRSHRGGVMAARKRSGFVREDQRKTERLNLRISPEAMQLLASLATEIGDPEEPETFAKTIEQALHAL